MIAVGIPWQHEHIPTRFMLDLLASDLRGNSMFIMGNAGDTDANRNQIVSAALAAGAEAIFFLDVDQGVPRDVRARLTSHGMPVVSALAAKRDGKGILAFREADGHMAQAKVSGLTEVDGVGMGCIRISADVFREIGPAPWFVNHYKANGDLAHEHDLAFCSKVRAAGIPIFIDGNCVSAHYASHKVVTDGTVVERVSA